MTEQEALQVNTTMLAYIGDAVYEVAIREHAMSLEPSNAGKAHRVAVKYVSSDGQAVAAKSMLASGFLTEREERLLKRARNHRAMSRPANADPQRYKLATGFEALVGWLHITEQKERLDEVIAEAMRLIESEQAGTKTKKNG